MIDDVIDDVSNEKDKFDMEAFKQKKNKQKEAAYSMIAEALEDLKINPEFFREYLKVQSRFDMYTPRNALLIAKQMPEAVQLKEWKKWNEAKISFRSKYPKKILLLDPKEPIKTSDGKVIKRIYAKEVIDVSETNTKPTTRSYDKEFILKALLIRSSLTFQKVETLSDNKICEWNKEENIIYVCNNDNSELLIQSVAKEIAKVNLFNKTKELEDDKATCVSYMLCKKYGIEPQIDVSDRMVEKYSKMESKDIADDLTSIKEVLLDMNNDISQYIEDYVKSNKTKEQER